jgi:hypothetical protein
MEWPKKNGGSSIVLTQKRLLSPIRESEEILPGSLPILSTVISLLSSDHFLARVLNTRKLVNCFSVLEKVVKTDVD